MEIVKITPRGYCHGVVDAIRIARHVGEETQGPVHMLGLLVHNTHVTDEMQEHGVKLVDAPDRMAGLDKIKEGTVIFTAYGVSPAVKEKAAAMGLNSVDATCSDVIRTHDLIDRLVADGYEVVYIGLRGHPEPEGAMGHGPGKVHLVQEAADIDSLRISSEKVAVTCQTTLSVWDTDDLIEKVKARYPQAEVHNEIRSGTLEGEEAAVKAAQGHDAVH